jgi:uncharacterized sulfatase
MTTLTATAPRPTRLRFPAPDSFVRLSAIWLGLLLFLRLVELVYNVVTHGVPEQLGRVVGRALLSDLTYFLRSTFFLYLIYAVFNLLSQRAARTAYVAACALLTLVQVALMYYFSMTTVPLGADLFGYSWEEIKLTVGAAGGFSLPVLGAALLVVGLVVGAFRLFRRRGGLPRNTAYGLLALSVVALVMAPDRLTGLVPVGNEYSANLAANKSLHLTNAASEYFLTEAEDPADIYADAHFGDTGDVGGTALVSQNYLDEAQYPFLHRADAPDVLGPFFKPSPKKPNIVLIIVEGLGRAFTGEDAYLGNFTPFVDSLARQSLYWENFLSEGGRTFAALPSLLGSLPFAKNGFTDLGDKMPPHVSLMSILKKNGYSTNFYYGGHSEFDNMAQFLKRNGADRISDETNFGPGYPKMPGSGSGFTWGYGDKALFSNFLKTNAPTDTVPKLQVLLTVSTHDPFKINEQDTYLRRMEARLVGLNLSDAQKKDRLNYRYELASVLYLDDALRGFFTAYRQRPDFQNTIFLITGDHRMPEIPMTTQIDRFHVPLIVYSPLLSRTATFRAISTHFDVAPSLLAFLQKNHGLRAPSVGSWLGTGLDTTRGFRNVHGYPMMMTKAELVDFAMGPYLLNRGKLYKIREDMTLEPLNEPEPEARLKGAFDRFKQKNERMLGGAKLVPDSVLAKYGF